MLLLLCIHRLMHRFLLIRCSLFDYRPIINCSIPFVILRSYPTRFIHTNVCNLDKNSFWSNKEYYIFNSFTGNVAYNNPTEQTGVWHDYVAERAVDGNTDTDQDRGSCAHPYDSSVSQAWWRVDLEDLHRIYSVTIYNTDDRVGQWLCVLDNVESSPVTLGCLSK